MPDHVIDPSPAAPAPGLLARILGVVFSPRPTYAAIVTRPRVLGAMIFVVLVTAGAQTWLMTSEGGQRALQQAMAESIREAAAEGREMTAEQRETTTRIIRLMGTFMAVVQVVLFPAFIALITAILMGILNALTGEKVQFRQAFAVVTHSCIIIAAGSLLATPLMMFNEEMVSPTRLAVLLPMLPEEGFLTYLLSGLDFLFLWWLFNLAIGLAVLYRLRTGPLATSLIGVYAGFVLLIAAVRSF